MKLKKAIMTLNLMECGNISKSDTIVTINIHYDLSVKETIEILMVLIRKRLEEYLKTNSITCFIPYKEMSFRIKGTTIELHYYHNLELYRRLLNNINYIDEGRENHLFSLLKHYKISTRNLYLILKS